MRLRKLIFLFATMALVVVLSSALAACGGGEEAQEPPPEGAEQPEEQPEDPAVAERGEEQRDEQAGGPEDDTLRLTVPKMDQIDNAEIPTGEGTDHDLFRDYAAVHLEGTGYPWEEEANVYIAGHRLGFPNTDSYLAFWDIEDLQNGDEIIVTDSEGTEYTYEVFETLIVEPTDLYVIDPLEGRNIVSLQSCTLPDYSDRVVVRGELVES